jgi:hypothetical protein
MHLYNPYQMHISRNANKERKQPYTFQGRIAGSFPSFYFFCGIYTITSGYSAHHFHLRKSISPAPPEGHSLLANFSPNFSPNFSQKFDQKLASDPKGSFYSIFCEKIVFHLRKSISPVPPGGTPVPIKTLNTCNRTNALTESVTGEYTWQKCCKSTIL